MDINITVVTVNIGHVSKCLEKYPQQRYRYPVKNMPF